MKIAIFDSYAGKFTTGMQLWWEANGYEVKRDTYYNPELVVWADIVWFELADNNLMSASNPDQALKDEWKYANRLGAWDLHEMDLTNKKIICRPIDIDVWSGHHASIKWDVVNDCIFVAPHIRDIMMADSRPQASDMKIHTIPCGVDLDKYTYKERQPGFNIAVISEIWVSKGVDYVLQIALALKEINPNYKIHWLGKWHDYHWEEAYTRDFIEHNSLHIEFTEYVDSVNDWLEDKHYLLHCSKKEAFSYATAEAMAKGIKPVLHRFYGADAIWPGITWSSIEEAVGLLTEPTYDSQSYRRYLYDHRLTLNQMMESIMDVIDG